MSAESRRIEIARQLLASQQIRSTPAEAAAETRPRNPAWLLAEALIQLPLRATRSLLAPEDPPASIAEPSPLPMSRQEELALERRSRARRGFDATSERCAPASIAEPWPELERRAADPRPVGGGWQLRRAVPVEVRRPPERTVGDRLLVSGLVGFVATLLTSALPSAWKGLPDPALGYLGLLALAVQGAIAAGLAGLIGEAGRRSEPAALARSCHSALWGAWAGAVAAIFAGLTGAAVTSMLDPASGAQWLVVAGAAAQFGVISGAMLAFGSGQGESAVGAGLLGGCAGFMAGAMEVVAGRGFVATFLIAAALTFPLLKRR